MKKNLRKISAAILYGLFYSVGLNFFIRGADIYSGGVTGLSQLINTFLPVPLWLLVFLFNVPLVLTAWFKLGRKFTLFTLVAILSSVLFLRIMPQIVLTDNVLLCALFGGAFSGIGTGICMREGFSAGGTDIVLLIVQKTTGKTVGEVGMIINGIIVILAGFLFGWEKAMLSLVTIFVTNTVMNRFYLQQYKMTMTIFTKKPEEVRKMLLERNHHGITVIPNAYGAYTNEPVCMLITVVSQYELFFLKKCIAEADEDAFVNIQPTSEIMGRYVDVKMD